VPQPRQRFEQAIKVALANPEPGDTAERIHDRLTEQMRRMGIPKTEMPSVSTIRRRRAELKEEDLREWREVRWPQTFGPGGLPWEAAPAALDFLAFAFENHRPRPLLRAAYWYWRISEVASDTTRHDRASAAWHLAAGEAGVPFSANAPLDVETWLLYGTWPDSWPSVGGPKRAGINLEIATRWHLDPEPYRRAWQAAEKALDVEREAAEAANGGDKEATDGAAN